MAAPKKLYGLIIPKKDTKAAQIRTLKPAVFDNDGSESESDNQDRTTDGAPTRTTSKSISYEGKIRKQVQTAIDKALQDDPNIYEYDEVYDQIEKQQKELLAKKKGTVDRKPKYIGSLLKTAESRQREHERRLEKKVQKEREAEGSEFKDKEVFVTGAYKEKMQQMQELEEKERREAAMEEMLDVTKQKDLSGFYRHLYKQSITDEQEKPADLSNEAAAAPPLASTPSEKGSPTPSPVPSPPPTHRTAGKPRHNIRKRADSTESEDEPTTKSSVELRREARVRSPSPGKEKASRDERSRDCKRRERDAKCSRSGDTRRSRSRDRRRSRERKKSGSRARLTSGSPKRVRVDSGTNVSGRGAGEGAVEVKLKVDIFAKRHVPGSEILESAIERFLLRKEARVQS